MGEAESPQDTEASVSQCKWEMDFRPPPPPPVGPGSRLDSMRQFFPKSPQGTQVNVVKAKSGYARPPAGRGMPQGRVVAVRLTAGTLARQRAGRGTWWTPESFLNERSRKMFFSKVVRGVF